MGFLSRETGEKLTTTRSENTDKEECGVFFLFKYLNILSSSVKKKFMLKYPLKICHM